MRRSNINVEGGAIILSGADEGYFHLLQDLLLSIREQPQGRDFAVGLLDFGLTREQREWLAPRVNTIVSPGWDLDFPDQAATPAYRKKNTALPHLPRYFPGFGVYVWLDADCWVQDWTAVELLIEGARRDSMAAVPEIDRCYANLPSGLKLRVIRNIPFLRGRVWTLKSWLSCGMTKLYGRYVGGRHALKPLVNSGVFAIMADAPHWMAWRRSAARARFRDPAHLSDQITLNHAIHADGMSYHPLPAWCNWICCHALPAFDRENGVFVEPFLPYRRISILHLAGVAKDARYNLATLDGATVRCGLRRRDLASLTKTAVTR